MKQSIVLLLVLVLAFSRGESKSCNSANECSSEVSTPYCIAGLCKTCKTNIDCSSPGYFCRTGSCVAANSGMLCNSLEFKIDGDPILPVLGQNDQLFCGSLTYEGQKIEMEWMGFCIHGRCAECVPSYDLSLVNEETRNFFNKHWDRTLMFPGTMCENYKVATVKSNIRSKLESMLDVPLYVVGSILTLLLFICILIAGFGLCYFYRSAIKKRYKQKSM